MQIMEIPLKWTCGVSRGPIIYLIFAQNTLFLEFFAIFIVLAVENCPRLLKSYQT